MTIWTYPMTRKKTIGVGLFLVALLTFILFTSLPVNGTSYDRLALIVVSSYGGTDEFELEKAVAFYDYLIDEGYDEDEIFFLTDEKVTGKDDNASVSDIDDAFDAFTSDSKQRTEVRIYVSDNSHAIEGQSYYRFKDGNISCNSIIQWVDSLKFEDLVYITLGNHSGLFGERLSGNGRVIMSSMRDYEKSSVDHFNITRSLEDEEADVNEDGDVSFKEAFYKEQERLEEYEFQNPEIWES